MRQMVIPARRLLRGRRVLREGEICGSKDNGKMERVSTPVEENIKMKFSVEK
jgi:hypothetical protein